MGTFRKLIEDSLKKSGGDPVSGDKYEFSHDILPDDLVKGNKPLKFLKKSVDAMKVSSKNRKLTGEPLSGAKTDFTMMQPTFGNNTLGMHVSGTW